MEENMTELETLLRAKMYIDKLANGINPLTDAPVSDDDCINQVRISRCLFYVSDVLRRVLETGNSTKPAKKPKKGDFSITKDELAQYDLEDTPIPVSEIAKRINSLIDSESVKQLKYASITAFLMERGYLITHETRDGKTVKVPTESGKTIGITREERNGQNGPYMVTLYNLAAQKFILDNIDSIIEINNAPKQ